MRTTSAVLVAVLACACGSDEGGLKNDGGAGDPDGGSGDGGQTTASVTSVTHSAAGTFTITFDATTTDHLSVTISTTPAPHWTVAEVARTSFTTWTVRLSDYPIPVDHAFTIVQRDDMDAEVATDMQTVAAADIGTRVGFVTNAMGDGNILGWAAVPSGSSAATGVAAADEICQAEADDAGLTGTFRALLTTDADDVQCRLIGETGDFAADCGLGAAPSGYGPWISPVGVPLVDSLQKIEDNDWITQFAHHADQTLAVNNLGVWIGFDEGGNGVAGDCGDWGLTTGTGNGVTDATSSLPFRAVDPTMECSTSQHLLCLQVDSGGLALTDAHVKAGKLAFVTSATSTGAPDAPTGATAVDALCQAAADSAGLNPGSDKTFHAYVSTDLIDAACRIIGEASEVDVDCGQISLNTGGPWVRVDGIRVADDLNDIVDGALFHPLSVTETGGRPTGDLVYTGSSAGVDSGDNCSEWDDTGENGTLGRLDRSDTLFDDFSTVTCDNTHHFYCFEQ